MSTITQNEAHAWKAKCIARGKLLDRFRAQVEEIINHAENEIDRVYFGSSNHFNELKEIHDEMDMWNWNAVMKERDEVDPYKKMRELRRTLEEAEARIKKLEDDLERSNDICIDMAETLQMQSD